MASLTTSGLAIVQHVPELQVDYRNLLKTIYSEPTEAKNKLGCKIWTLFKNCNCATGQELSAYLTEQIKDKLGLFCSKFYALEIIASTVLDSTNHSKFGIGGKELNLMVSLTTSVGMKRVKRTENFGCTLRIINQVQTKAVSVSAPNVTLILCPYVCWSSLGFFLVQLILVRYLEPLFSFCRLIASMLDSYYFRLLECKIEMVVPSFH
nr:hypothetical protein CFP56_30583 [Quercus suber]